MSSNNLSFLGAGGSSQTFFERSNGAGIVSSISQLSQILTFSVSDASSNASKQMQSTVNSSTIEDLGTGFNSSIEQLYNSISLYLYDEGSTLINSVRVLSTGVQFNNEYTFPLLDGTANQVLQTNGSGVVSWATVTSTNIYNSNGVLTGARNVDLNGYTMDFADGIGTSTITLNINDGADDYSYLSQNIGGFNLTSGSGGFSKSLYVNSTGVGIYASGTAGTYYLPNSQPLLNQIPYASSTSQLGFTSVKTINSNSILGSGNISVGTVNTLTTLGTSGVATLVGSTLNIPNYSGGAGGYATIEDEGSSVTQRTTMNFIGTNVVVTDDAINSRTDITIGGTADYGVLYSQATFTYLT
jgi:hypothetical protein